MAKKLSLKVLPEGIIDIKELVHLYGKDKFKKIKQFSIRQLPDESLFLELYDRKGQTVKPKGFPKIGRKKNMSKKLWKIANGK
jgi:hypothetical protein